jgi:hypothetical protein
MSDDGTPVILHVEGGFKPPRGSILVDRTEFLIWLDRAFTPTREIMTDEQWESQVRVAMAIFELNRILTWSQETAS